MKNKKLIVLASVFLMATTALAVSGCKPTTETPETPSYTMDIQGESVSMILGEKKTLTVNYDTQEGAVLAFASSDPSVVTVNEYGEIEALKLGTATITATYGELTDTCTVEVTLGDQLPMLQMPTVSEEITTYMDQEWELSGNILFNGNTYTDVELAYEVEDATVGKVEDGVFKPLAHGTTTVTVTASWRGVTQGIMTKTITITVVPKVDLVVNGGIAEINLSTEAVEGTDYVAASPFEIVATIDGVPFDVEATQTSGELYVDFDGTTVSSKGFTGEAEITLTYELFGETKTLVIPVHVTPTIYNYEGVAENFSIIHGEVAKGKSLRSILGADIIAAEDENGNPLTVDNNKIFGLVDNKSAEGIDTTITIYSARRGYTVRLNGYSGVFAEAEDFEVFNINAKYADGVFYAIEGESYGVWDGYYVLANNIDATNYEHNVNGNNLQGISQSKEYPCGLHGTFDGRGYTIKGMTFNAYGLFGYISSGATVKDVALTEVKFKDVSRAATLAQWIHNATIFNVYVQLAEGTYTEASMSGFVGGIAASVVSACIVEVNCVFEDKTSSVFACALNEYAAEGDGKTTYAGVYVISGAEILGYYNYSKTNEYRYFYAENKMPAVEVTPEGGETEATPAPASETAGGEQTEGSTDGSTGGEGAVDPELPDEPATPVQYTITFMVDGVAYATVVTSGNEVITLPANPTVEGKYFNGWYLDEAWKNSFKKDTLKNTALTADLTVYARLYVDVNYAIKGVFAYATVAEMLAAENVYTNFNAYWDMTSGTPVWKSINGEYPVIEEEESGFSGESVGDFNPDWIK